MAVARFLDRMCSALQASVLWFRYATLQNLKGSNFAIWQPWLQGLYWTSLFVAGLCVTVPALIDTVNDYLSYPVSTKVQMVSADNATFPAVTICGLNRRVLTVKVNELVK